MTPTTPARRRVGEVAAVAGVTVRTLHYYEEIGLLVPSARTGSGHRLYTDDDVALLYRITLLRDLGLPLADVASTLREAGSELTSALRSHLSSVERRLAAGARLRARLSALVAEVDGTGVSGGQLMEVLEAMSAFEPRARQRVSILVYADIEAAFAHLTEVFGLGPGSIERAPDGQVVHASLEAGDGVIWLHPESEAYGLASPRSLGAATATMAIMVDDVDDHHAFASSRGADIVYEPVDQPYGYREYSARDPEGGLWSFMRPLPETAPSS